jgi:hypothetical protein
MKAQLYLIVLASTLFPLSSFSASGSQETAYRCRDANGQMHFGSSMPPECNGQDTEVLSGHGNVIRIIEGTKTLTEKAARHSAEEAEKKAKADAELRDRMLVDTYLSIADIERLRDQRLDLVQGQLMIDEQTLKALLERQKIALTAVQSFKPYSATSTRSMPENMVLDMVGIANNLRITEDRIASKKTELQDLQAKFTSDILRFKELKGMK